MLPTSLWSRGCHRGVAYPWVLTARRAFGANGQGGDGKRHEACARVRLHPKQQRMLPLLASVRDLPANVCRPRDRFAADAENDIADLEAVIGGDAVRVDSRDDRAAVGLVAGRQRGPSFGTSLSGTSCSFCWFAACFSFGRVPSVSITVFS
jgi:hypothetical protein